MIKAKSSRCAECEICMEICAWSHFQENNPKRSRIWIQADWPEAPKIRVCVACKDHECIWACPNQALSWGHWLTLDKELCDSCGSCAEACPVGGIRMDPITQLPLACDTCEGRYECVNWCPTQALARSQRQ